MNIHPSDLSSVTAGTTADAVCELIIRKIIHEGPIRFAEFMELALYAPGLGYYTLPGSQPGINGDYYTSATLTCVYGQMIAKQLEEMWLLLDRQAFTIVEFGAGDGRLCRDILQQLSRNEALYAGLRYCIIERNTSLRQKSALPEEKVSWHDSIDELPVFNGCVLSNELLDNFAVSRVMMTDQLMEIWVDYHDGFVEVLRPANDALLHYLETMSITLPYGYHTEICLQATEWITAIADRIGRGFVLTVDYGYPARTLYHPARSKGTLACYYQHQLNFDPYRNIGRQDITAHVNFSAIQHWGEKAALSCNGFTSQRCFLQALGIATHLNALERQGSLDHLSAKEKLFLINTLLLDLGEKLKVLIQQKNVPMTPLTGMQLAAPAVW